MNRLPTFYAEYDTAIPMSDYLGDSLVSIFVLTLLAGFGVFLAALALDLFLDVGLRGRPLPRPAIVVTLCVAAVLFGVPRALAALGEWIPGDRYSLPLWNLQGASTLAPSFAVLASAFWAALLWSVAAGVLVPLAVRILSPRSLAVWVVLAALAVTLAQGGGPALLAYHFATTIVMIAVMVFLLLTRARPRCRPWRRRCSCWRPAAAQRPRAAQPSSFYRWHGIAARVSSSACWSRCGYGSGGQAQGLSRSGSRISAQHGYLTPGDVGWDAVWQAVASHYSLAGGAWLSC